MSVVWFNGLLWDQALVWLLVGYFALGGYHWSVKVVTCSCVQVFRWLYFKNACMFNGIPKTTGS